MISILNSFINEFFLKKVPTCHFERSKEFLHSSFDKLLPGSNPKLFFNNYIKVPGAFYFNFQLCY